MFYFNTEIDLILQLGMGEGGGKSLLIVFLHALVLPLLFQWSCYDAT